MPQGRARQLYLWPDEAQTLLLKAALWDGDAALDAFRQWRGRFDLAGPIEGGTYRLLPLLHANMVRLGCDDPIMGVLKGVRRHSWCQVQRRIWIAAQAIELLGSRGIETLVSKGLPLALAYYENASLRPMSDVDLYVRSSQARQAIALLQQADWKIEKPWEDPVVFESHETCLHRGDDELDLHWHVLHQVVEREASDADRRFWSAALPIVVGGAGTLRPCGTDLLMHVAVHGLVRNPQSPIRWIADAAMIVGKDATRIDWHGIMDFAQRFRLAHRLGIAFEYLASEIGLPIPQGVLDRIARTKPSLVERIEKSYLFDVGRLTRQQRRWRSRVVLGIRLAARPVDAVRFTRGWLGRKLAAQQNH